MTKDDIIATLVQQNEWLRQLVDARDEQIWALKAQLAARPPRTALTGAEHTRRYRQRKKHQQGL